MDTARDSSCQDSPLDKLKSIYPEEFDRIKQALLVNKTTRIHYEGEGFFMKKGGGHISNVDDFQIASKLVEFVNSEPSELLNIVKLIKEHLKEEYRKAVLAGENIMSKREFIEFFVKRHKGFVDHQGNFKGFPFSNVDDILQRDMRDYSKSLPKDFRFDWKDPLDVNIYKKEVSDSAYELLQTHLKYDGSSRERQIELAERLAKIWRDPRRISFTSGSLELDARVILHFIWNCKRRLHRMTSERPLFIIAHGTQGCGKSIALLRFLSPLTHKECAFASSSTLERVSDIRWDRIHSRQLVLIIDELVGLKKADVEKLKSFITTEGSSFDRTFCSQNSIELYKYTSYIGTTNIHLAAAIKDPTGMRRFWQIYFPQKEKMQLDFDAVNNFPYEELWRSVNQDDKYSELMSDEKYASELHAVQKTLSLPTNTQLYIEETNLLPMDKKDTKLILISTIYTDYKKMCKSLYVLPTSQLNFRVELKDRGVFLSSNGKSDSVMYVQVGKDYKEYSNGEEDAILPVGDMV